MKLLTVNNWSTGMNNEISPDKLGADFARTLINADITDGIIQPLKKPVIVDAPEHFGDATRSIVKWFSRTYYSDNINGGLYGVQEKIGIPTPDKNPTAEIEYEGEKLIGEYNYLFTFTNKNEWEGPPSESTRINTRKPVYNYEDWDNTKTYGPGDRVVALSQIAVYECIKPVPAGTANSEPYVGTESIEYWKYLEDVYIGADRIDISDFPSLPDEISRINIYRTVNSGNDYYRIGEVTTESHFIDTVSDEDLLLLPALTTKLEEQPPENAKYLSEYDGVFFCAVDDRLFFSKQSNPHAWNSLDWIGFEDDITGIGIDREGLLVLTSNRAYRVRGTDAESIIKDEIPSQQGTTNWRTVQSMNNYVLWVSNDGLCAWNGDSVNIISKNRFDFSSFNIAFAVVANDKYYMFTDTSLIIVFDLRNDGVFYTISFDYLTFTYAWYEVDNDKLYMVNGDNKYSFDGEAAQWSYFSGNFGGIRIPRGIAGRTVVKQLKRMWIVSDGPVNVFLNLDDDTMQQYTVMGSGRRRLFCKSGTRANIVEVSIHGSDNFYEFSIEYQEKL